MLQQNENVQDRRGVGGDRGAQFGAQAGPRHPLILDQRMILLPHEGAVGQPAHDLGMGLRQTRRDRIRQPLGSRRTLAQVRHLKRQPRPVDRGKRDLGRAYAGLERGETRGLDHLHDLRLKRIDAHRCVVGLNTKLHAVTDAKGRPLQFFMTAGQVSDYTGAAALLGSLPNAEWLIADRGYDADWLRESLKDRWIRPCIPGRKSRGKTVRYDKRRYRRLNRIEIMFGRLKNWRRIATRYDRCAKTLLSAVALAPA